ncbi:MAG: serine/threonine-protein kinase [Myxococcaceae bacterium]
MSEPSTAHPEPYALLRLATGQVPPEERAQLESHVSGCTDCAAYLSRVQLGGNGSEVTGDVGPPRALLPEPELPAGTPIGHFRIEKRLGLGGMGVVYLARDTNLDRSVALKLLRADTGGTDDSQGARTRLLREAHAMARLNHPNVVTIYEVGAHEDRIFFAMELVDGGTLRAWLKEKPRTWREVLDVFIAAGRGLEAAHAAGLVHRDFKPENVLISSDGRVRVTDFGVARAVNELPAPARPNTAPITTPLESPLTVEGSVVGTVAYMSPEQFSGAKVDARSDLYSFCFALYEALYGERPFKRPGETQVAPPPAGTAVPAWLRAVVVAGLHVDPFHRTHDLKTLLAQLERPPMSRARLAAIALAAVVLVAAGVFGWKQLRAGPCNTLEARLGLAWNDELRHALSAALGASPEDAARWPLAEKALDRYAQQWLAAGQAACTTEQPPAALGLQLECLEERRSALSTITHLLSTRDDPRVRKAAVIIVDGLPMISSCADPRALSVAEPVPPKFAARAEALREELLLADVDVTIGLREPARKQLRALADEAKAMPYAPLVCAALSKLASSYSTSGKFKEAREVYRELIDVAEPARLDGYVASASMELLATLALMGTPREQVDAMIEPTMRLIARVGRTPQQDFLVEHALALVYASTGRTELALPHAKKALEAVRVARGGDSLGEVLELNNYGAMADTVGDYSTALQAWNDALALEARLLGSNADTSVLVWANIALTNTRSAHWDDTEAAARKVIAIGERRGENLYTAIAYAMLGNALSGKGQRAEASEMVDRALKLLARLGLENAPDGAEVLRQVVQARVQLEDAAGAATLADTLMANEGKRLEEKSQEWIVNLHYAALAFTAAGQRDRAVQVLERALALVDANASFSGWRGEFEFTLARAVLLKPADKARATQLAKSAADELAKVPDRKPTLLALERWRAATLR